MYRFAGYSKSSGGVENLIFSSNDISIFSLPSHKIESGLRRHSENSFLLATTLATPIFFSHDPKIVSL